jgi:hypothetical protein
MGPFRVNLSKAGVGLSLGVPAFRVGTGPRGNYIQMGAHGIYYRAALPSGKSSSRPVAQPRPVPVRSAPRAPDSPPIPDNTLTEFEVIESSDAAALVDSSSAQLLQEIRRKHGRVRSWPVIAIVTLVYEGYALANALPQWALLVGLIIGVAVTVLAYRWDIQRKLVVLHYELADSALTNYSAFVLSASTLARALRQWHISAQAGVKDRKYHAGASISVRRKKASVGTALPPFVVSNLDPVAIALSKSTFYFFPDRILVYSAGKVGAVAYTDLEASASATRFIEDQGVSRDAKVVDHTWQYVNKAGGPDRRFKNNRKLPVCEYGQVELKSVSGVNELLMFSVHGPEPAFVAALRQLR